MCIIFYTVNENATDGEYKLILAANRDEFYARPALPAAKWIGNEFVIGGRDMEPGREGGTWLAISTKDNVFKLGALLNITGEPKTEEALPRGDLVSNYVISSESNKQYCQEIIDSKRVYSSFALVTIEINRKTSSSVHYCSVTNKMTEWPTNKCLGFGNSLLACPLQKVNAGQRYFEEILKKSQQSKDELVQNLMGLLCKSNKHWPDVELHRRKPEWSELLSSIYVKIPQVGYGSRTRTVILIDANNNVDFYEETMATTDPDGEWIRNHLKTDF